MEKLRGLKALCNGAIWSWGAAESLAETIEVINCLAETIENMSNRKLLYPVNDDFADVCEKLGLDPKENAVKCVYVFFNYNEEPLYVCFNGDWKYSD